MKRAITISILAAWVAVIGMIIVIFSFSSQSGRDSVDISGQIIDYIIGRLNLDDKFITNEWLVENRNYVFRKILHFTEYFILSILVFNGLRLLRLRWMKASMFTLILTCTVASIDEFYQSSVPGRNPQLKDVLIDFSGGFTAVVLCLLIIGMMQLMGKPRVNFKR